VPGGRLSRGVPWALGLSFRSPAAAWPVGPTACWRRRFSAAADRYRIEPATLFYDPTRLLLRTRSNPLTSVQVARLRVVV
jgi:hypothetical protein